MLEIRIDGGRTAFAPEETVSGHVSWHESEAPRAVEIRLLWHTEGRGDQDVGVAGTLRIEAPSAVGSSPFQFECPHGPLSFSGRLVSLLWAIEATVDPQDTTAREPIVIAPGGHEIDLTQAAG